MKMVDQVRCVIHNIKKPKMFGQDVYNIAVTDARCLFAKLTGDLLNKAAADANREGKGSGKGFLERWGDQMAATMRYGDRYLSMSADEVMSENRDNFAVAIADIKSITFREVKRAADAKDAIRRIHGEVTFDTKRGKTTYQLDGMPVDDIAELRAVIGDRVRG